MTLVLITLLVTLPLGLKDEQVVAEVPEVPEVVLDVYVVVVVGIEVEAPEYDIFVEPD